MKIRITAILLALLMLAGCATVSPVAEIAEQTQEIVQTEETVQEEAPPVEVVAEPEPVVSYEEAEPEEAYVLDRVYKNSRTVYIAPTGKRYHYRSTCAGKNAMESSLDEVDHYYTPCQKCVHD